MNRILGNGSASETITSGTFGGFHANIRMVNPTATGTLVTLPNFDNIKVSITLRRNDKDTVIFNDSLKHIIVDSALAQGIMPIVSGSSLIQKGLGSAICPIKIPFHGVIKVRKGDTLQLECTVASGTYNATYHNISSCYIDCDLYETSGTETRIPRILVHNISADSSGYTTPVYDDVVRATFINLNNGLGGSSAYTDANTIITGAQLRCAEFSNTYTPERIVSIMQSMFPTALEYYQRGQCVIFAPEASVNDMDNFKLTLSLASSLVTAGNNAVVVRFFDNDEHTFLRDTQDIQSEQRALLKKAEELFGSNVIRQAQQIARG